MKLTTTLILAIIAACLSVKVSTIKLSGSTDNRYRGDDLGYE